MTTPGRQALLRTDCLHLDAVPHWLASPWFPTHWDQWVFPVQFGPRLLYVSTGGILLFLPQVEQQVVIVEGVTGDNKCDYRIERERNQYKLSGTFEAQPVSMSVELAAGRIAVEGPAAYVPSSYTMTRQGKGWTISGMTGEFESMYRLLAESDNEVRIEGFRRGKDVDAIVFWEGEALHFEDGNDEFRLRSDGPQSLVLSGRLKQETAEVTFTVAEDELRVVGSTGDGKVDYKVVEEANGLTVKGRYYRYFVNYRVATE